MFTGQRTIWKKSSPSDRPMVSEALIEVLQERNVLLYDMMADVMAGVMSDVLEDQAMVEAIREGANGDSVVRSEIMQVLDGVA